MKPITKKVDIENIQLVSSFGKKIDIRITGYFRDTGWSLKPEEIDINEDKKTITIALYGKRDPNIMAAQVLKKFEKRISLMLPSSGQWTIECNNQSIKTSTGVNG